MIALKENEALAMSVGVDVTRYLVLTTVVSAAMAGAAGALYAHYVRIVDPDVFLFLYTVTMVIMVMTGGKGTLAGPIVGGLIFGLLPEVLRGFEIAPELQWIFYGVLMILVLYFLGLNLSNEQIARELDLDPDDVQRMATLLREGIVQRKPEATLSGEVECDEVYVVAGHKGYPEAVRRKGGSADADG